MDWSRQHRSSQYSGPLHQRGDLGLHFLKSQLPSVPQICWRLWNVSPLCVRGYGHCIPCIKLDSICGVYKGNLFGYMLECFHSSSLINIHSKINPCYIFCNSIKTILLITYVLDNLYMIHERPLNELFIKKRFMFYQHPVDRCCSTSPAGSEASTGAQPCKRDQMMASF